MSQVLLFSPETAILVGALAVFAASVAGFGYRAIWISALVAAGASTALSVYTLPLVGEPFFPGIYQVDAYSQLLKLGLSAGLLLVLAISGETASVRQDARDDLPLFLLLSVAGMMLLVSATELLTLYVALELSATGLYIGVALSSRRQSGSEAGARYVLFGAVASAITLYGISLVLGATGTTYLAQIRQLQGTPLLTVGLLLMFVGLFFKLAVFPLHFWAPDVYEAAPHQVVAFVGTTSKVAAVGIIGRVCTLVLGSSAGMVELFMVLAVASMTLGNLGALVQRDLKRLLGYSTVAHAGYLMVGYSAFSEFGLAATLFYVITYLALVHLVFVVISAVGRDGSNPSLDSLAGLHSRSPGLALMLLVAMFGLAGIPPTVGFLGKWFLFSAALEHQHFVLVLVAAINSTVALYYYLQVIKAAYLAPAADSTPIAVSAPQRYAAYVSLAVALVAGVYPTPLWRLAQQAASALVGGV